jgi:hypothetical protein
MPRLSVEGALGIAAGVILFILDKMRIGGMPLYVVLFLIAAALCVDSVVRSEWAGSNKRRRLSGGIVMAAVYLVFGAWIFLRPHLVRSESAEKKPEEPRREESKKEPSLKIERPSKHLPQSLPPIVINSPDPYVGTSNQIVARWARDEADRIEVMGKKCGQEVIVATQRKNQGRSTDPENGFYGPEFIQTTFRSDFDSCCKQVIVKLHDSITLRLGPATLDSVEEIHYRELIDFNDIPQRSWPLCMEVQGYSRDLRKMAERLLNR